MRQEIAKPIYLSRRLYPYGSELERKVLSSVSHLLSAEKQDDIFALVSS